MVTSRHLRPVAALSICLAGRRPFAGKESQGPLPPVPGCGALLHHGLEFLSFTAAAAEASQAVRAGGISHPGFNPGVVGAFEFILAGRSLAQWRPDSSPARLTDWLELLGFLRWRTPALMDAYRPRCKHQWLDRMALLLSAW